MCFPWYSLIISYLLGILSMFAFRLALAKVARGGVVLPGGEGISGEGNGRI